METILNICAHNDDHLIGAGGTLAKYAREGKRILTVVFSYGEGSHMYLKRDVTVRMRVQESHQAEKMLTGGTIIYLGLKEGDFPKEIQERKVAKTLSNILRQHRPTKIFTHSIDDLHPDHRAINGFVLGLSDKLKTPCEIYSYDVWNPIKLRRRNLPRLVVDITDTMAVKMQAFRLHRSQQFTIVMLYAFTYIRAYFQGLTHNVKYAEVFYRER